MTWTRRPSSAALPLPADPRYPASHQAAYQVMGDSMNGAPARIHAGMFVLAVSRAAWERLHGEPSDGRIVIVARTRNGQPEQELTLKRLRIFRDRYELRPESTNPRHTPLVFPLPPPQDGPDGSGETVEIIAIVLQAAWLLG